ncbi:MAG: RDAC family protein [Acutalibacteraceae bacterium]|jgi:hypothetical protein
MERNVTFTYDEVLALKKAAAQATGGYIHFHDACGGQSFSFDQPDPTTKAFVEDYFAKQGMTAVFTPDGTDFTVRKGSV